MIDAKLRNDQAEKALLGSLLIDPRRVQQCLAICEPRHFFDPVYAVIWQSIAKLHREGTMIEPVAVLRTVRTLRRWPDDDKIPETLADAGYFADHVTQSTITGVHALHYARIVAQTATRRELVSEASKLDEGLGHEDRDEVIQRILRLQSELRGHESAGAGPKLLDEQCQAYLDQLGADGSEMITLGLPGLDLAISGGTAAGELVVMAARPGHGKTMCAMQILEHAAECGLPGLIISEEMSAQLLAGRSLLHITDVQQDQWAERREQVREEAQRFFHGRSKIQIADPCGTINAAVAQVDKAAANGCRIVVVDYAQLLKGKGTTRYEQVTNVSVELKQACIRHGIAMVLLCQLSRPDKTRKPIKDAENQDRGVMPKMTDLRDSGQLEQDADVIVFLQWPLQENAGYKPYDRYFMYIAKNRNRATAMREVECKIIPSKQILVPSNRVADFDEWNVEIGDDPDEEWV